MRAILYTNDELHDIKDIGDEVRDELLEYWKGNLKGGYLTTERGSLVPFSSVALLVEDKKNRGK